MKNETKGILLGLMGVSAFGLTLPATRVVVPHLDPIFIGLGRAVLAAVFAAIFLLWFRQKIPTKKQMYQLSVVALGVVVGFPVFSSWAMQYVSASHGGVVLGILPLATALVGVLIGSERPSFYFWLVSVIGSGFVILYALSQGSGGVQVADIALLGAIFSAAIGYAVGARLSKELGGWQVICWALVLAFPFILFPAISYAPESLSGVSVMEYASFLYLALVSQLFGFFVWYKGLALGGIARVSQIQLLQPFITLFASVLFLGEVIDIETMVFVLLVVGSVWLGKRMPIREKV
ncbi:Permease of the drug/metabolite transporter (DMT) superfamily [hydrothermal vent metagenome]|uniref:Permease of the drug/metabolite transporter (DMT) superfamily n=1 Tax=hydrothermal vent metagenome TaxID=652676 RepID=A0A3B0Z820_9ZZZZ